MCLACMCCLDRCGGDLQRLEVPGLTPCTRVLRELIHLSADPVR